MKILCKNIFQFLVLTTLITIVLMPSCTSNKSTKTDEVLLDSNPLVPSGINYEKLKGTWILHDENGYASIEIRDTNQVLVNYYLEKSKDKATQSRDYFYYQSIGNMGFWSKNSFWISTDKYRMDFDWLGDKLKEIVKDGEGDMYYRVYTEEEIAYQFMDSSTLDGRVRNVFPNKEKGYYEIIMNNSDGFYTVFHNKKEGKTFSENLIQSGDSLSKDAFSTTLFIHPKNKDTTVFLEIENRMRFK